MINTINRDFLLPKEVNAEEGNSETIIGTYTTYFGSSTKERKTNIRLASDTLNGTVIKPNSEFSFNETIGPNKKEKGYLPSKIFIDGKESIGIGGGICQVSSTLYNSLYYLNFDITERNPHSKKVNYVPNDRDAATSYGGIDFKFINNKKYPIKIKTMVTDSSLRVDIVKTI